MQIDQYSSPCKKFKIKDVNINPDTLNLKEEKVENYFDCTVIGDNFHFLPPLKLIPLSLGGRI